MSFGFTSIIYIFTDSIQTLLGILCILNVEVAAIQEYGPSTNNSETVKLDISALVTL
jgi:hypothetical protein